MKRTIAICILTALCLTCLCSCDMGNGLIAELFGKYGVEELPIEPSPMPVETIPNYGLEDVVPDYSVEETWTEIATEPPVEYPTGDDDTIGMETGTVEPDYIDPAPQQLVLDGDLSDWALVDCWKQDYDASNLDAWVGEVGDGGFTMYVSCDLEFVYLAFDVRDTTPVYSETDTYNGDCFQIQLDLGGIFGQSGAYERAVFYSFGVQEDGSVNLTAQCIKDDVVSTVDYVMSSKEGDLKGVTVAKTDGSGWIAEFAIPWERLVYDALDKLGTNNLNDLRIDSDNVKVVMLVCYIDRQVQNNQVIGAWGTSKVPGALATAEGWYPENGGIELWFDPGDLRVEDFDIEAGYYLD